jgi:hypothetical protein
MPARIGALVSFAVGRLDLEIDPRLLRNHRIPKNVAAVTNALSVTIE